MQNQLTKTPDKTELDKTEPHKVCISAELACFLERPAKKQIIVNKLDLLPKSFVFPKPNLAQSAVVYSHMSAEDYEILDMLSSFS